MNRKLQRFKEENVTKRTKLSDEHIDCGMLLRSDTILKVRCTGEEDRRRESEKVTNFHYRVKLNVNNLIIHNVINVTYLLKIKPASITGSNQHQ